MNQNASVRARVLLPRLVRAPVIRAPVVRARGQIARGQLARGVRAALLAGFGSNIFLESDRRI